MNCIPKLKELFDLSHTIASEMLEKCEYAHEALPKITEFIKEYSLKLDDTYSEISEGVFVANDAKIWDHTTIVGPTIICHGAEIRPGAFIRGSVIIGEGAVIGNSTELKNCIVFDKAQLPHYNYVGDSIIGFKSHLGAGAIASNLRLDNKAVKLGSGKDKMDTGLRKVGVFLGDHAECGCGCVLCPGTIIGRNSAVYPLVSVKGIIPENHVFDGTTIKSKH